MIDWLLSLSPVAVCALVGLVVGLESLGLPLPGETTLVGAALLASQGTVSPVAVAGAAALGASIGDSLGYALGRRFGQRLFDAAGRRFPRHFGPERIARARRMMARHGFWAVFAGRFIALLRILAGPLAGSLRMPYRRFALANVSGAILWAAATTALVVILGRAAEGLLRNITWGAAAAVAAVVVVVATVIALRKRRHSATRTGYNLPS